MYMTDNWTFLVELSGDPPLATLGTCLIDLSSEDDRGDVEPFVDRYGVLHCTLGCEGDGPDMEMREIVVVHEYLGDMPFNGKIPFFMPVSIVDFVSRFCDAASFDGDSEDEILKLKEHYGVLRPSDADGCPRGGRIL